MKMIKWYQSFTFTGIVITILSGASLITVIALVMNTTGRNLVLEESQRVIEKTGAEFVSDLRRRLQEIAAIARTMASAAEELPKDEKLFYKVMPKLIDSHGDSAIAGGGVWPEPFEFETTTERRSFFWGREPDGTLKYYDDYNQPGAGYRHEEWYVVSRYLAKGVPSWSRSYVDPYSLQPMVTVTVGTFRQKIFTGTVTIDLKLEGLQAFAEHLQEELNGYVSILDRNNRFVTFPQPERIKTIIQDDDGNNRTEFLFARDFAAQEPLFRPIAQALEKMNARIVGHAQSLPDYQPELVQKIQQDSYQIDQQEAQYIAAMIADPLSTGYAVIERRIVEASNHNEHDVTDHAHKQSFSTLYDSFTILNDVFLDEPALVSIFYVPQSYWKVVLVTPLAEATQLATTLTYKLTLFVGVIVGFYVLLSYISVAQFLLKPITRILGLANAVAEGDFSQEFPIRQRDEIGELGRAVLAMKHKIQAVLEEVGIVTNAIQEGHLDTRGQIDNLSGDWRQLVSGINTTLDAVVGPLKTIADSLDRLSKSEIPNPIVTEYAGDFQQITSSVNTLIYDIRRVLNEIGTLSQEIQAGQLNARCDSEQFGGGWQQLTLEVNNVVDTFMEPFTATAFQIQALAQGTIPEKMARDYQGQFNDLKQAVDTLIDNLSRMLQEVHELIEDIQQGQLSARGDVELFVGEWQEMVRGINAVVEAFVVPFRVATQQIVDVSEGRVPETMSDRFQGDFNQLQTALTRLINATNDITHLAEKMANGNLSAEVRERSDQDTLMRALNTMIQRLKTIVSNVQEAAKNVADGSVHVQSQANKMSRGTSEQAASAEEVSISLEEMTASGRQTAENAQTTGKLAQKASKDAREGGEVVAKTVTAMQQIAQKISIIREIAEQTHLLSLNATIEAAKAEEYGKGFAVVASEVRALAARSRQAAQEIDELVSASVTASQNAGKVLTHLVPSIIKTTTLVQEITSANHEQHLGTVQINDAMQQLDGVIQQNVVVSQEMTSTANELAKQADYLQQSIAFFKGHAQEHVPVKRIALPKWEAKDCRRKSHIPQTSPDRQSRGDTSESITCYELTSEARGDGLDRDFERY